MRGYGKKIKMTSSAKPKKVGNIVTNASKAPIKGIKG
jgi:hypothetical protein